MRRLLRLVATLASLFFMLCLTGIGLLVAFFGTHQGQEFIRRESVAALGRMIGPDYVANLGRWSFELRQDGLLAIGWNDVAVGLKARPQAATRIGRMSLGLRLAPLFAGRLEFGRLEIHGVQLDLAALDNGRSARLPRKGSVPDLSIARAAAPLIGVLEQEFASLHRFHFETIALSDIRIDGFSGLPIRKGPILIDFAELRRSETGALEFLSGLSVASLPLSMSGTATFEAGSDRLTSLALRTGAFDLARVSPPGPAGDPDDERPFGSDADVQLTVALTRPLPDGKLESRIEIRAGSGAVQFGSQHTHLKAAELILQYREGDEKVALLPSWFRFDGAEFLAEGVVDTSRKDAEGKAGKVQFRLGSQDIRSTVGASARGASPQRAGAAMEGFFDLNSSEVHLSQIEMVTPGGDVRGSGVFRYGSPTAVSSLRLMTPSFTATSVKAFWPINAAGKVRSWILAHAGETGRIVRGSFTIDLRHDRLAHALRPDSVLLPEEFRVNGDLEGIALDLAQNIPPLHDVSGHLETRGGRTTIRLDGTAQTNGSVVLKQSTFTLTRTDGSRILEADAALNITADLPGLIDAGDRFGAGDLAGAAALPPEAAHGTVAATVKGRFLFGPNMNGKDAVRDWSAVAQLSDVAFDRPIQGRRLSGMNGQVTLSPTSAAGSLKGEVDGVPADINFTLPLGAEPSGARSFDVDFALTADKATEIMPVLKGVLGGAVQAEVAEQEGRVKASVDLNDASIDLPLIAWNKGKGVPAKLSFFLEKNEDRTAFRDVLIQGDGFAATGTALTDATGLRSATLQKVSLNPGDDISLKIERAGNGYSIEVRGDQLDARPILEELRASIGQTTGKKTGGGTFDVTVNIARLNGFDGRTLRDFSLNYASNRGRMAALSLSGSLGDKGRVSGDLSPRGAQRAIRVAASDLGALAEFTGLYAHMEGGEGSLDLIGTIDAGYTGTLRIDDFTLVDEPRLSRIVGSSRESSSLSGAVGKDISTERAPFDHASAKLAYDDKGLRVDDGIVRGPLFGSSFEGTLYDRSSRISIAGSFMPAYGINRMFGAIPLVGQILGNGNEGGLIGITYRLSGAFDKPQLSINPISAIAPGIFRQIFAFE